MKLFNNAPVAVDEGSAVEFFRLCQEEVLRKFKMRIGKDGGHGTAHQSRGMDDLSADKSVNSGNAVHVEFVSSVAKTNREDGICGSNPIPKEITHA